MKYVLFFVIYIMFLSCSKGNKSARSESNIQKKLNEQTFNKFKSKKHSNVGVIFKDELKIYNLNKEVIKNVKGLFGEIVTIDSVSIEKFDLKESGDRCDLLNFVKVSNSKINGWVCTSDLYEKDPNNKFKKDKIEIIGDFYLFSTKNFSFGFYDEKEGGLSFCDVNDCPILIKNDISEGFSFVKVDSISDSDLFNLYPKGYITFNSHDGWEDKIVFSAFDNNNLFLKIKREYQEGVGYISLDIIFNPNNVLCNISDSKIEYPE